MACDFCGTTIVFGGVKQNGLRFCNQTCANNEAIMQASLNVPEEILHQRIREIHQGECPACSGHGPVDVHTSHWVWSALILTRWGSSPRLCCRSCARRNQLQHAISSFVFGWWGFPWGLIFTPVQVGRNVFGFFGSGSPDPEVPSATLERMVRVQAGSQQQP